MEKRKLEDMKKDFTEMIEITIRNIQRLENDEFKELLPEEEKVEERIEKDREYIRFAENMIKVIENQISKEY
jgi:regulator of replication initiation timing